jgi:hypothetical protein
MPEPSALGTMIEEAFAANSNFAVHPAGHTEYLLRFRTAAGVPLAIGRTAASGVRVWMAADERFRAALESDGFICVRNEPRPKGEGKNATGRNSNLEQIPEFMGAPLYWVKITTPGEAFSVASRLR